MVRRTINSCIVDVCRSSECFCHDGGECKACLVGLKPSKRIAIRDFAGEHEIAAVQSVKRVFYSPQCFRHRGDNSVALCIAPLAPAGTSIILLSFLAPGEPGLFPASQWVRILDVETDYLRAKNSLCCGNCQPEVFINVSGRARSSICV